MDTPKRVEKGQGSDRTIWTVGMDAPHRRRLARIGSYDGVRVRSWDDATLMKAAPWGGTFPLAIFFAIAPDSKVQLAALRSLSQAARPTPVIAVSPFPEISTVVKVVKAGASEVIVPPFDEHRVRSILRRAVCKVIDDEMWCTDCTARDVCPEDSRKSLSCLLRNGLVATSERDEAPRPGAYPFVASSECMLHLDRMARRLADSDLTVLIRGESGVGKEVVARHIHHCSTRADGPFIKVNCAALPESLLESELFGHERGAFTGAVSRRPGKFEEANGGTIFLDEISEMPVSLQAKLLHVLQDQSFSRLGGTGTSVSNCRVVAATNTELEEAVAEGDFREDLYFRLKVVDLWIPPLRARPEEVRLLTEYFLCQFARQYRRPRPVLSETFQNALCEHDWPGNVRELENMIKRIVVLGEPQSLEELGTATRTSNPRRQRPRSMVSTPRATLDLKKATIDATLATERDLILAALRQTNWNRKKASDILGVCYKTIRNKVKKYNLRPS